MRRPLARSTGRPSAATGVSSVRCGLRSAPAVVPLVAEMSMPRSAAVNDVPRSEMVMVLPALAVSENPLLVMESVPSGLISLLMRSATDWSVSAPVRLSVEMVPLTSIWIVPRVMPV